MNTFISADVDIICRFELIYNDEDIEAYKVVVEDMNADRFAIKYCIVTKHNIYECKDEIQAYGLITRLLNNKQNDMLLN